MSRELLARAAGGGPGGGPLTIDLDSTICETYGLAKEGARHHGYTGARGYHPLLATAGGTGGRGPVGQSPSYPAVKYGPSIDHRPGHHCHHLRPSAAPTYGRSWPRKGRATKVGYLAHHWQARGYHPLLATAGGTGGRGPTTFAPRARARGDSVIQFTCGP